MPSLDERRPGGTLLHRARTLAREPFFHFVALGLLIFLARGLLDGTPEQYRITIGPEDVRRIAIGYEWQFGRPPTARELSHLVDRHIEEEILYREGVAMGLDVGDEIVRRRVVQKLQFLQEDVALPPEPDDAALQAFHVRHTERYAEPARVTLRHQYFSPDTGGAGAARARAAEAAAALRDKPGGATVDEPPGGADPFPGRDRYVALDGPGMSRAFGDSELASAVFELPPGAWHGPLRSGYGWHLVYVEQIDPGRERPLAEVREEVRADYLDEQRAEMNAAALAAIKGKYVVVREDLEP
ncbi:MAG: peptidyl-prolyl cis-trans isomerase [Acidobacteria bacterium]|nr:peptidyl-prolyl cis-trans isomerase [Acidobacteriota bacterium]